MSCFVYVMLFIVFKTIIKTCRIKYSIMVENNKSKVIKKLHQEKNIKVFGNSLCQITSFLLKNVSLKNE